MAPQSPPHPPDVRSETARRETISLRTQDAGLTIDALVLSKRADRIHLMLHEGAHSVFCELKPTPDGHAYVGTSLGRDVVYERSREQVEADVAERGSADGESPAW